MTTADRHNAAQALKAAVDQYLSPAPGSDYDGYDHPMNAAAINSAVYLWRLAIGATTATREERERTE